MTDRIKEIRTLLERWYDASTTPAEETRLRNLLERTPDLPADLRRELDFLRMVATDAPTPQQVHEAPDGLEQALLRTIDKCSRRERFARRRSFAAISLAAAALLAIVFGIDFSIREQSGVDNHREEAVAVNVVDTPTANSDPQPAPVEVSAPKAAKPGVAALPPKRDNDLKRPSSEARRHEAQKSTLIKGNPAPAFAHVAAERAADQNEISERDMEVVRSGLSNLREGFRDAMTTVSVKYEGSMQSGAAVMEQSASRVKAAYKQTENRNIIPEL